MGVFCKIGSIGGGGISQKGGSPGGSKRGANGIRIRQKGVPKSVGFEMQKKRGFFQKVGFSKIAKIVKNVQKWGFFQTFFGWLGKFLQKGVFSTKFGFFTFFVFLNRGGGRSKIAISFNFNPDRNPEGPETKHQNPRKSAPKNPKVKFSSFSKKSGETVLGG